MAWVPKCSATVPFAIGRIRRGGLRTGKSQDLTASSISRGSPTRPQAGLQLRGLSGFLFSALFERGFARKFYAAFVVDADAFDPNHFANFGNVFGPVHAKIRELGNMHEPIFAREHFDERAEFFDRDDATLIGLADLDLARHAADDFLRARHAFAARRIDVHRAVVFDINLRAGLGDDALDRLAAGPDERADFLRIDFDRLDPRRVFATIPRAVCRSPAP